MIQRTTIGRVGGPGGARGRGSRSGPVFFSSGLDIQGGPLGAGFGFGELIIADFAGDVEVVPVGIGTYLVGDGEDAAVFGFDLPCFEVAWKGVVAVAREVDYFAHFCELVLVLSLWVVVLPEMSKFEPKLTDLSIYSLYI